ncbi:MAG: uroporphyrinogen-III synthase [Candidatus Acidiferrales bacterium]
MDKPDNSKAHEKHTGEPLAGKRVVVTRAPEQAQDLVGVLEALGATVLLMPTVSFAPPEDSSELDAALRNIEAFDWILFTSQNAVRFVFQRGCKLENVQPVQPARPLVAAVGVATALAARHLDLRVDYVAVTQTGESLAAELRASMGGKKVFLPRSDRVDDRLPAALREAGAEVREVVAYRTLRPATLDAEILGALRRAEVDAIAFASPSAFQNLATFVPAAELVALSERVRFAAIGSTTTRALREAGVRVAVESNDASSAGLADAIAKYFQRQA